jgi:hypothetical protein
MNYEELKEEVRDARRALDSKCEETMERLQQMQGFSRVLEAAVQALDENAELREEMLPYSKKRDYTCTTGTIANAFCHNSLFKTHVSRWELQGASERILKLRNQLRKELEL